MLSVKVHNMKGEEVEDMNLPEATFGAPVNVYLLHEAVKNYLANQRQGTQSALTRTEVRGGGRKPFRQKGTGRARQGSTRAPQWTHGGVVFAPKPRSYRYSMNKKAKRGAMKSALSSKVVDGNLIVVDNLMFEEFKTKKMIEVLKALNINEKVLLVIEGPDSHIVNSARNIPDLKTLYVNTLNVYDIIKYDKFLVTKEAVNKIGEVYQ